MVLCPLVTLKRLLNSFMKLDLKEYTLTFFFFEYRANFKKSYTILTSNKITEQEMFYYYFFMLTFRKYCSIAHGILKSGLD